MSSTQEYLQTFLNMRLNAAVAEFIKHHPDTDLATILRALDDAKTDADVTRERALA